MNDPLVAFAAAVMDAIWWPIVIGVPIYAALIFGAGVMQIRAMDLMMTVHERMPPASTLIEMSEQKPPGAIGGILSAVLGYVDRPFRLFAIIMLFVVGGFGWVIYEQREELIEAWLTPSSMSLATGAVPAALDKLVAESSADLVQIWSVDLGANSQRFLGARRRDGERPVIPEPRRLPVVVRSTNIGLLINVMAGSPACVDLSAEAPSPVVSRLAARGMTRACAIPIPPSPDAFLGVIYMSWTTPPELGVEEVALVAAREIAGQLVRR